MAKYTVHAGHAAVGYNGTGAVGYCAESYVDRQIKDAVIKWLRLYGNSVYDCTVDKPTSIIGVASNIVTQIKKKINSVSGVTANISIHLNASKKASKDGKVKGVECCVYDLNSASAVIGTRICKSIATLGFTNRGNKKRTDLGVLKGINNGGANILVECFFCDDEDDYLLYQNRGADAIGKSIAEAIIDKKDAAVTSTLNITSQKWEVNDPEFGRINLGMVFDSKYYVDHVAEPEKILFQTKSESQLRQHFYFYGMKEGRQAHPEFNVKVYKERYLDLQNVYGNDLPRYYKHYCLCGKAEGRKAI